MSSINSIRKLKRNISINHEYNNNTAKYSDRLLARNFMNWYKSLIDNNRQNFVLYLADNVTLEWFGRTIKKQKNVASFFRYDVQDSRHDFQTIESVDCIRTRQTRSERKLDVSNESLANPLHSPEIIKSVRGKKRSLEQSVCLSPDWETPDSNCAKRSKSDPDREITVSQKGDGDAKTKFYTTPPSCEVGQGDCLPSTSGLEIPQLCHTKITKKAVECTGFIEFTREKSSRNVEGTKWERKCKLQISYSEDPINIGEYILWGIYYSDESKCRRNLLAAFEEVAALDGKEK